MTSLDVLLQRAREIRQASLQAEASPTDDWRCSFVAVKDNVEISPFWGLNTTAGSILLNLAPRLKASHEGVERLERVLKVLVLGKSNMDDWAMNYHSYSTRVGQTRNVFDSQRFPGGSSGGSAVAVASKAVRAAIGTDTGGSIRIPAMFAGVVGMRPTKTNEELEVGVVPLSHSRDTVGVIARSVEEAEQVFAATSTLLVSQGVPSSVDLGKRCGERKRLTVGVLVDMFPAGEEENAISQYLLSKLEKMKTSDAVAVRRLSKIPGISTSALARQRSTSNYEFERDISEYFTRRREGGELDGTPMSLPGITEGTKRACARRPPSEMRRCNAIVRNLETKMKFSALAAASASASSTPAPDSVRRTLRANLASRGILRKRSEASQTEEVLVYPTFTKLPSLLSEGAQKFCANNRLAAALGFPVISIPVGGGGVRAGPAAASSSLLLPASLDVMGAEGDDACLFRAAAILRDALNRGEGV